MPPVLLLGITATALAANDSTSPVREALHQQYHYTASARVAEKDEPLPSPGASDDTVLRLEKMTIVESAMQRDLARDVHRHWDQETERQFSWQKGGLIGTKIVGAIVANYGIWPHFFYGFDDGGRHLVRQGPANVGEVKVEFLRMRW